MAIQEDAAERKAKMKALMTGLGIVGSVYVMVRWYITQSIAAVCDYNPLLGPKLEIFGLHIYPPLAYNDWVNNEQMVSLIPEILDKYRLYPLLSLLISAFIAYAVCKDMTVDISHGSARFATPKDIEEADLGIWKTSNGGVYDYAKSKLTIFGIPTPFTIKKKQPKGQGVVVGVNPYNHRLMLHDGPEHILLMAPTRSGKGVSTIIPTGITWGHSIFFFDPKGELWQATSNYRKNALGQKVLKFQPLCSDGSACRWNPFGEINYRTLEEWGDITTLVNIMIKPDGDKQGGSDPFWDNSSINLLVGVFCHLLYMHHHDDRPLPCPTDIMSFLSSGMSLKKLFHIMMTYQHIHPHEFLELPYKITDADGNEINDGKEHRYRNPLKEIYGEYIKEFVPYEQAMGLPEGKIKTIDALRDAINEYLKDPSHTIDWTPPEYKEDEDEEDDSGTPWHKLLTHPRVAEAAANIKTGAEQTSASILQTAQASLAVYRDPVVQRNTAVSDFNIRDLLDPRQAVSLYFVLEVKDIKTVKPIARLFIDVLLSKLIKDMKFEVDAEKQKKQKKQRLLLMLDEFPQLGNIPSVESAMAICAGYGIKMCIVCQDINQLNKAYTKDNSIASNCHVHIYFTPNNATDSGGTAKAISDQLGKKTIKSVSHSDGGGGFGKGSDSTSAQGRELMTPDEVAKMSLEKELVFVAGHYPIFGDKLRYYQHAMFLNVIKPPPTFSDTATAIHNYEQLFAVHQAESNEREDMRRTVAEAKAALFKETRSEEPEKPVQKFIPIGSTGVKSNEEKEDKETSKDSEGNRSADSPRQFGSHRPDRGYRMGQNPWGTGSNEMRQRPSARDSELLKRLHEREERRLHSEFHEMRRRQLEEERRLEEGTDDPQQLIELREKMRRKRVEELRSKIDSEEKRGSKEQGGGSSFEGSPEVPSEESLAISAPEPPAPEPKPEEPVIEEPSTDPETLNIDPLELWKKHSSEIIYGEND